MTGAGRKFAQQQAMGLNCREIQTMRGTTMAFGDHPVTWGEPPVATQEQELAASRTYFGPGTKPAGW